MTPEERQRFSTIGSAFLGKVAQRLQNIKPEELSAADLARWTDVAAKLVQAGATHEPYDREARERAQRIEANLIDGTEIRDGIVTDQIEMEAETSG